MLHITSIHCSGSYFLCFSHIFDEAQIDCVLWQLWITFLLRSVLCQKIQQFFKPRLLLLHHFHFLNLRPVSKTCGFPVRIRHRCLETSLLRAPEPQAFLRRFVLRQPPHPPCSPGSTAPAAVAEVHLLPSSSWPGRSWSPALGSLP